MPSSDQIIAMLKAAMARTFQAKVACWFSDAFRFVSTDATWTTAT